VMAIVIASLFTILSELQKRTAVEKLLKTVLDSSLSGIQSFKSVRDLTGKIIDFRFIQANAASYKMVSASAYSFVGKTLTQVSPHIKSHELFDEYVSVVETGLPLNTEHYYNYDGIGGWYRIVAVKLEDGFTVTFDDITEAKRTKLELENNLKALKHSNEELEQFANVASHDLQEPLRKILAFIDRLKIKNADVLSEESKSYFDRIVNSAYRMRTLINDLLSYSRVGNGQLETVTVDLNKQLKEVLTDLEMVIQQKKATISLGKLPVIEGREVQLQQLFQNLISNSLKFSYPLRTPVIEVTSDYIEGPNGKEISEATITPDSFCRIKIKDNGIGFEEQDADKIFRIFYRLHGRSEYEGSGIGLAICKKIVDNHHGTIIADGNPGIGSTFIIVLPLKQKG
jgi:signal transduction histidine kinase